MLEATRAIEDQNRRRDRHKRRKTDGNSALKIGHGGTLDPMATGVLIVGIGRGTKSLQNFLDCTKTYETVVLFGKSTDTYDVAGKVIATAAAEHINKETVEERLKAFRGSIQQVPPIYSALKIDGMKAYDYARSGKELPRELAARKMTVSECVMTEWCPAGEHDFRWPAEEAPQAEKDSIQNLMIDSGASEASGTGLTTQTNDAETRPENSLTATRLPGHSSRSKSPTDINALSRDEKANLHTHKLTNLANEPANAPAVRVRLTVSSGFYVRSFAHDLGIACGSYGSMAELARTRQAEFSSSNPAPESLVPALDHADLAQGEAVWGPKITKVLEKWIQDNPAPQRPQQRPQYDNKTGFSDRNYNSRKRRNSSSPE